MNINPFSFLNPSTVDVADSHRKQQLLLGYLIGHAATMALIANSVVVPIGLIMLGIQFSKTVWSLLTLVLLIIGVIVALLTDSMTLATSARIRKNREVVEEIEKRYDRVPDSEMTESIKARRDKDLGKISNVGNWCAIVLFVLISGGLGDIFWHWLLQGLHNDAMAWTFSTLFSLLISGVMVSSQLSKKSNDLLIHESIHSDNHMAIALKKDADAKAVKILAEKYETEIVSLAENTEAIKLAIAEHSEGVYDQLLCEGKGRIPLRIKQDRDASEYASQRERELSHTQLRLITGSGGNNDGTLSAYERVARFMEENPRAINKDIVAALPDIPEKTVKVYASQVRSKAG